MQRKKEKVKDPISLRENSVCLMQQGVSVYWLAAEKACHRWSFIYMLEGDCTARSTSEFKNYLTVNHGLHDVAKKFGIQKFTVIIYWKCTGYLLSSFRFPANSKQSTLWRYCVQECPNFNIWGFGLRSKRFEGSRLYSKIILGLPGSVHPLSPSPLPALWNPNLLIKCYENQTVFPSMIDGCRLLLIP